MTDILEMNPETYEQKKRIILRKTCELIKQMNAEGSSQKEITDALKLIKLPLDIHLAVFGHYSEICKFGRILTDAERRIFRL